MSEPRRRISLAARLFVGQTTVLLASVLSAGLVASVAGPSIFHSHLLQAGHEESSPETMHIEQAYRDANAISLGVALLTALTCALVVTWILARRMNRPVAELTAAARELSRGHYHRRVREVGSGTELDTMAAAFNSMAGRLHDTEDTRRRLLSDLAHELRTPIATLTAYHEALFDGVTELDDDGRAILGQQTSRLARLAADIDEVSRAEEGRLNLEIQPHRVSALILAAGDGLRASYEAKGVNLVLDTSGAAGLVVPADAQRIGQVLTNLLTNALRHTPSGGTVTVSAELRGDETVISVSDDGEGIDPAQRPHLFERFYRGDNSRDRTRSGSGIGLTISKAIADAHGGAITAHSDGPGRGARFELILPNQAPSSLRSNMS